MKIASIICTFPPYEGGMGNSANNFARELAKLGHEVTVFTPDYGKGAPASEEDEGIKIKRLKPFFKYGNAAFIPQVYAPLKDFDIIHLHYPFFGAAEAVLAYKMAAKEKAKLVVHYHMDTEADGPKGRIFKLYKLAILPLVMKYADAVVCSTLDYAEDSDIAAYLAADRKKFFEVPFGVDANRFQVDEEFYDEKEIIKRKERFVLFVGGLDRAHYFKGLDNLLQAFAKVAKDKDYFLSVVGTGEEAAHYKDMAKSLGIGGKVRFFERVSNRELPGYYHQSDVFVLPSVNRGEAFGLVLLEAMASGKPVIASSLPGVRMVFTNGREGLYVRPRDIGELAEKLDTLLSDPETALAMGKAGRKLALDKYSWRRSAMLLEEIFSKIKPTQ